MLPTAALFLSPPSLYLLERGNDTHAYYTRGTAAGANSTATGKQARITRTVALPDLSLYNHKTSTFVQVHPVVDGDLRECQTHRAIQIQGMNRGNTG